MYICIYIQNFNIFLYIYYIPTLFKKRSGRRNHPPSFLKISPASEVAVSASSGTSNWTWRGEEMSPETGEDGLDD